MRLGYLMAYNEANWIGPATDQAMMLCDKLLIVEGSQFATFPDISERSDDGTLDVISDKEKQYPGKIKIIKTIRENRNYRKNQCANFNLALSHCDVGDYFIILASDEFYLDNTIEEMNRLMDEGKMDCLELKMMKFIFGFKWAFGLDDSMRIFKKTPSVQFFPTCRADGLGPVAEMLKGISVHHYTWVKPRERLRLRMRTSGMYKGMVEWFNANWDVMEPEDGKSFDYVGKSYVFKRYDGEHPSILSNHPWRDIEDIRRIGI